MKHTDHNHIFVHYELAKEIIRQGRNNFLEAIQKFTTRTAEKWAHIFDNVTFNNPTWIGDKSSYWLGHLPELEAHHAQGAAVNIELTILIASPPIRGGGVGCKCLQTTAQIGGAHQKDIPKDYRVCRAKEGERIADGEDEGEGERQEQG